MANEISETDPGIPYLELSAKVVSSQHAPGIFIESLFPGASEDQVAMFTLYCIGIHLAGIELAHDLIDGQNLAKEAESYTKGYRDGFLNGIG